MADIMEFPRGDGANHIFDLPADNWTPGGKLFFAAKQVVDDDNTDSAAVIKRDWDDTAVTDVVIDGVAYKEYACDFPPSATNSIPSNGAASAEFLGEFQYVPPSGVPITYPPKDEKIMCMVYFDVNRRTT